MLDTKLTILELVRENDTYGWLPYHETWGKIEPKSSRNIFSSVAMGARTVEITLRPQPLTLRNALLWGDIHLFISSITNTDRHSLKLTAAIMEPKECELKRGKQKLNELNRLVPDGVSVLRFPAYLTEKYIGHTQSEPQVIVDTTYVLITPKDILISSDELVTVEGKSYTVLVPHLLDNDKNEYEIYRTEEP